MPNHPKSSYTTSFLPLTFLPLAVLPPMGMFLVGGLFGAASTPCLATSADFSAAQLSRIWREEFPLPSTPGLGARRPSASFAPPIFETKVTASRTDGHLRSDRPHPAVARIIVPEAGAISYGSGTLIDVREKFGMVITNWHVVRDATGTIEVVFPGGFTSKARALKVDADWDLAALVIWRPPVEPVAIAAAAPQPGDQLTICGYGQGNYRCATGRCTQYYAPRLDFPRHMVELDVEARQGDSGGPIFNRQGDLAGVLFGAGQGTTLGSFGGRVGTFLATLAPDIGRATESLAANQEPSRVNGATSARDDAFAAAADGPAAILRPHGHAADHGRLLPPQPTTPSRPATRLAAMWPTDTDPLLPGDADDFQQAATPGQSANRNQLFEQMKTVLAAIGLLAIVMQMLRVAR